MPNALAHESSLYLRSHADQPIHWMSWTPEALSQARASDKPILLSIGYSSCHWCHVMAHESFEDLTVANLLNEHFISIKVDREERPDLDKVYQLAHQLLTGRGGGWPLTLFLDPQDLTPFFAGTYFPLKPRYGMPAFSDLLAQVLTVYRSKRAELNAQAQRLITALADTRRLPTTAVTLTDEPLAKADQWLTERFDQVYGGFGGAPKFPHSEQLEYLCRRYSASYKSTEPSLQALYQLSLTLTRMAEGGLFDQLGGGFYRYSVDDYWMIPHFEKMLYDNGLLLSVYAKAALITGERLFLEITRRLADWLLREFEDASGLFYASQDADSEGHEGKFYVWQPDEIKALLNPQSFELMSRRFGLDRVANFENEHWHLHAFVDRTELAQEFSLAVNEVDQRLSDGLGVLYQHRQKRIAPTIDPKLITAWNAMAIEGLIQASRTLQQPHLLRHAQNALDAIDRSCFVNDRLISVRVGQDRYSFAFLDDVAYLLKASLASVQREFRWSDLNRCRRLADELLRYFRAEDGGFWMSAHDAEPLIDRPRSIHDEAIPCAAAIATHSLLRLGYLLNEPSWIDVATQALTQVSSALMRHPAGLISWLEPLSETLRPPQLLILRGEAQQLRDWQALIDGFVNPHRLVLALPDETCRELLTDKPSRASGVVYCCDGFVCQAPIHDTAGLLHWLQSQ